MWLFRLSPTHLFYFCSFNISFFISLIFSLFLALFYSLVSFACVVLQGMRKTAKARIIGRLQTAKSVKPCQNVYPSMLLVFLSVLKALLFSLLTTNSNSLVYTYSKTDHCQNVFGFESPLDRPHPPQPQTAFN